MPLTAITFFERFEADILSGKKTITIRDASERDFAIGSVVPVSTFEAGRWFCDIKILAVTPITLAALTEQHAEQENMTLAQLVAVIREIYPNEQQFYVIDYQVVSR
ncbi:MAG: N(4)-acetylcytidine aminohydrolase [Ferrimonas sp.]